MKKAATISLQDLRRRIYRKAKAEPEWRFWGMYVHVCKMETLQEAYRMAKRNGGAPGIDAMTFEAIEESGLEAFLDDIRRDLVLYRYRPSGLRKKRIPKGGGKFRTLGIPTIRDRVVQGALKLILEPIFEADFQDGSYGYRPKRTPHAAVHRVTSAVVKGMTRVIDVDLASYFDTIRHHILLWKVAVRVKDNAILWLLKRILKSGGNKGVPQGGVISPLLSNIYLNEVDRMLERAKAVTRERGYFHMEYARFADDLVIVVDGYPKWGWLERGIYRRLLEELAKLDVSLNVEKTRRVDLTEGASFTFLGFRIRRYRTKRGRWGALTVPRMKARTKLLRRLKEVFRRFRSQPVTRVIERINPILRGWLNYFRIGQSSRCFRYIRNWVELKIRRHLMRARGRRGYGWKRWNRRMFYERLGLYDQWHISYYKPKARPRQLRINFTAYPAGKPGAGKPHAVV